MRVDVEPWASYLDGVPEGAAVALQRDGIAVAVHMDIQDLRVELPGDGAFSGYGGVEEDRRIVRGRLPVFVERVVLVRRPHVQVPHGTRVVAQSDRRLHGRALLQQPCCAGIDAHEGLETPRGHDGGRLAIDGAIEVVGSRGEEDDGVFLQRGVVHDGVDTSGVFPGDGDIEGARRNQRLIDDDTVRLGHVNEVGAGGGLVCRRGTSL